MKFTFSDENHLAAAHNDRGCQLSASGDFDGAKSCFLEALGYSPNNPEYLSNLAITFINLQQYFSAEKASREALSHDPTSVLAARFCALALVSQGKQAKAFNSAWK